MQFANKILIVIFLPLVIPLLSSAQKNVPRFENDTLYTTSGYKIYIGQILRFAKGTGNNGNFRYVKIKSSSGERSLTNRTLTVKKLSDFEISGLGNGYISIWGTIKYPDNSTGSMYIRFAFDRAIDNFAGLPAELIIPDEYMSKQKSSISEEIEKLYRLYKDSVLTKDEFEAAKKKLLGN